MLTAHHLVGFANDGYLVIRGAVPEQLLSTADAEIDQVIQQDPPPTDKVGPHFYFRAPSQLPAADAALRRSEALALAERLVAPHGLGHALDHIQIALI